MKRILSLLLTLIFVSVLFASCGKSSAAGTYTLETIGGETPFEWIKSSIGGDDASAENLLDLFGVTKENLNEKFYILTLDNDGNAYIYSEYTAMYEGFAESEGVWRLDGDVLTVTVNGEDIIMTFKDGILTRDINGVEGVFRKS